MFDFLFPKQDPNTNKYWKFVSQDTKSKLKTYEEVCYICKKTSENFKTHFYCKKDFSLEKVVVCFHYNDFLKKILLKFKYYHVRQIGYEISQIMKNFFLINLPTQNTVITFVPMHPIRKFFIKWYNQSEILAKNLSTQLNLPLIKICKKIKYTKPQAKIKTRNQRLKNLQNSFSINQIKLPNNIKHIVIIDDVITTWITLEEITKCIKQKYLQLKVYWLILARK